jgi:hypothetical protein
MIKFICKDLWLVVFRKQIDNLKTNHRGTFVLTDNKFLALGRMSVDRGRGARGVEEALGKAQPVCFFFLSLSLISGSFFGWVFLRYLEYSTELFSDCYSQFLYFPCGVIRGALSAFGLDVTVHAETSELPQAIFQIRTVGSKP